MNRKKVTKPDLPFQPYTEAANQRVDSESFRLFIEQSQNDMISSPWYKLNSKRKKTLLIEFSEKVGRDRGYCEDQIQLLRGFLIKCVEEKKIMKSKDVDYDLETQQVVEIKQLRGDGTKECPFQLEMLP